MAGSGLPVAGQGQAARRGGVLACEIGQTAGRELRVAEVGGEIVGNIAGVQPVPARAGAACIVVEQDGAAVVVDDGELGAANAGRPGAGAQQAGGG